MFNWIDRVYKNARKKIFKNLKTGEILELELQDDPSNIEKESPTPLTAHCLNLAQQELVDDMSKIYMGMNITADTVAGIGRINKVYGKTTEVGTGEKSPTNPYTLECVGDDVNLFDIGSHIELNGQYRNYEAGQILSSANFYGLKIPVQSNTKYVASADIDFNKFSNLCFFDKDMNYISGTGYNTIDKTFTTPTNCSYITLAIQKDFTKFKLQKGSVVTPWSPYGYDTVENISKNKNLLKNQLQTQTLNGVTYNVNNDKSISLSGTNTSSSAYDAIYIGQINIEKDGTYFLSGGKKLTTYLQLYNANWSVDKQDRGNGAKMQLTKGTYHVRLIVSKGANCDGMIILPQLECGEVATEYTEYQQPSSNIVYVDKPLCSVGNVRDELDYSKGKITRRCGEIVLNGTEIWQVADVTDDTVRFIATNSKAKPISRFMCDKLKVITQATEVVAEEYIEERNISKDNIISIRIKKSRLSSPDVNGFNAFLAANPITLTFELATPIEEDIECSDKIVQYDGQTTVYNRDGAEIEVSLTNNKAISEVNEDLKNNEMQKITNENGTAIKFPDGTMICTIQRTYGEYDSSNYIYSSIWNYPVPFVDIPIVTGSVPGGNSLAYTILINTEKTRAIIQTKCLGKDGTKATTCDRGACCMAIGRWK